MKVSKTAATIMRGRAIAPLVPLRRKEREKGPKADIAARLKKVFGAKVISDKAMAKLAELNKAAV